MPKTAWWFESRLRSRGFCRAGGVTITLPTLPEAAAPSEQDGAQTR